MATQSLAEIEAQIASTKEELKDVHGTEAEVYARIVGYYRSVRNWNKGKRDEYNHRKLYEFDDEENSEGHTYTKKEESLLFAENAQNSIAQENYQASKNSTSLRYEFFSRKTCPNCPPVKEYLENVKDTVVSVDVDSENGLARATELGVFAAPTVILFNGTDEIGRAHSADELAELVVKTA
ncbi:MAG TPA: anaerobic ribonucleoside-triphosphate reductase [Treponemataceae bacterium]|nr:anaerobic ribonucleoside-triphosphate reductase [Treponemataceae bacterium]